MQEHGLQASVREKKYSDEVHIRRRKMNGELSPDLIKRNFFALESCKPMVEDITGLPCLEQTMDLNSIEDLFNDEILAYAISDSTESHLCTDTDHPLQKRLAVSSGRAFTAMADPPIRPRPIEIF
jgi:transposase InsO family protein